MRAGVLRQLDEKEIARLSLAVRRLVHLEGIGRSAVALAVLLILAGSHASEASFIQGPPAGASKAKPGADCSGAGVQVTLIDAGLVYNPPCSASQKDDIRWLIDKWQQGKEKRIELSEHAVDDTMESRLQRLLGWSGGKASFVVYDIKCAAVLVHVNSLESTLEYRSSSKSSQRVRFGETIKSIPEKPRDKRWRDYLLSKVTEDVAWWSDFGGAIRPRCRGVSWTEVTDSSEGPCSCIRCGGWLLGCPNEVTGRLWISKLETPAARPCRKACPALDMSADAKEADSINAQLHPTFLFNDTEAEGVLFRTKVACRRHAVPRNGPDNWDRAMWEAYMPWFR